MVMIELENLKDEFLNKFLKGEVEKDAIKSIRKVLKEFKEYIYGGDSLQKILSANNQGHTGSNSLSGISGNTSNQSNSSQHKQTKNQSNVGAGTGPGNTLDISSEVSAQSNQQRFLLVAACEEIQKLLKYIVQPYIIAKSCITTFETSGKNEKEELERILKQEFLGIEKRIVHVLNNYQEVLPINIIEKLKQLKTYYQEKEEMYIKKNLSDMLDLKQARYVQLQAPFLGYHLVLENKLSNLFENPSTQIENIRIQRVGTEFVHHFQKYLTTYVFNKLLMNSDILAGMVICIKDNKKKKTYFFIQYCDVKVEDIDSAFSQDQQILVNLNKYGQKNVDQTIPTRNVDMNSFMKQILASFISMSLESFIPNYGICSETGKIYRHQINTTNEDRTAHAGIKNPLYFFKECFMIEKKSSREFEECLNLQRCNMANFLEALTLLHEFQKTDFKFEFKKGRKLQSLYLPKEHISSLQGIVQEFSKTLIWLEESVFPVNGRVCLLQIINQIQPLIIEFSNRIMSKSMQEHLGFMKKISIEDFLIKIASKKALKKYIIQNKSFEDNRFQKEESNLSAGLDVKGTSNLSTASTTSGQSGSSGQSSQSSQSQQSGQGGNNQGSQSQTNQNSMTASTNFSSSIQYGGQSSNSTQQGQQSLQGIQLSNYLMELNLLNFHQNERKVILKYAAEHLLYLPQVLSLEDTQEAIKKFNKSWRNTQVWSDNYTQNIKAQYPVNQPSTILQNRECPTNLGLYKNQQSTPVKINYYVQSNILNESITSPKDNQSSSNQLHFIEKKQSFLQSQDKQSQKNNESIFVEMLGLVFNMNIMSILTNQTFQNIQYFDEDNPTHISLIKSYFKFPQVRGDKGFKLSGTLLERSINLKKYKLASLLLDQGEGVRITKDVLFNYLSENKFSFKNDRKTNHFNQNYQYDSPLNQNDYYDEVQVGEEKYHTSNKNQNITIKMCQAREEFDEKLQSLVKKHHSQWLNEFNWEKMWRQEFNPLNYQDNINNKFDSDNNNLLVYTYEYGVRSLPIEVWSQIFDFKRMDIKSFNQLKNCNSQTNLSPEKVIEEEEQEDIPTSAKDQNRLLNTQSHDQVDNINQQTPKKLSFTSENQINHQESEGKRSKSINSDNQIQENDEQGKNIENNQDIEQQKNQECCENNLNENQEEGQEEGEEGEGIKKSPKEEVNTHKQSPEQEQKKSRKNTEELTNEGEKLNIESEKIEEGDQVEPFIELRQRSSMKSSGQKDTEEVQNFDKQTSQRFNNRKQLSLNLDEEKVNQTLRLQINTHNNTMDFLEEGNKLCGALEMKSFSYLDEKNYFIQNYLNLVENSQFKQRQKKLVVVYGKNLDLLIEENPQYPGLGYAEDSLVNILCDHARPKQIHVRINDIDYTFTQILHNCTTLQNRIKQGLPLNFEKQSLGERIILSMIINKQYSGFQDEILEIHPTVPKEFRLINISSSLPFQSSIIRYNSVNYAINVRNIIFCLDQMNETIDPSLILKYRQLNAEKLLDDWQSDLYLAQQRMLQERTVINNPRFIIQTDQQSNQEENTSAQQAILFQKSMIKQIYNRLLRLTRYLKKNHVDDHSNVLPKYQELFDVVSPLLADMYKRVNTQKDVSLAARFEQIETNLDKIKSFVTCDIPSFYSNFTLEKIYNYESLEEIITTFKSIGPHSAKEIIKQLAKLSRRDNNSWEDVFQNVNKNSQIRTIMINGQLESDWNDMATVEKFIQQICIFQQKSVSEFKHLLQNLIFDTCDGITWKMLRNIGLERITTLSLRGCTKITDADVVKISESMPMLTYLDLSKNQSIYKFNQTVTSKYQQSKPLQFPQLKTLILEENINMSICDVEGQHIQNINVSTCILLQYLMTKTPNLKRMCLNMCPSLLEEHAILYILEGTNCILDETTSNGAFKQPLLAMSKFPHSKLNSYKMYVLSLFGRLFNKIKIMQDVYPLVFALNRRGLNKAALNKESVSFFGFSKKPTTTPDSIAKSCRMSILNLLLKNSNIRELKFMHICEEFRDMNISSLLETLCEKFQESAHSTSKNELVTDIDTIDLSDIKLKEINMKHLGEIISLIKTTSSSGLSIFLQSSQDPQNKGLSYFCQGALKTDINKIDFSKNKLNSEQVEEICKMIEGVSQSNKLSQLFLKNCRINNDLLIRLSKAICKNQSLRLLDLSDNSFDHEGLKPFMQSLYDNTTLTSLMLDGNSLSGPGFASIQKGRFLKKLHLEQCWLEEQDISYLCQLLQENQQLNYLDISYNKVNINSTLSLIQSIKNSNCLKELIIKKIFDEDESIQNASRISEILINNTTLQTLDISGNSIGSDGLIQFGKTLSSNSALRVLIINDDHTFGLRGLANLAELIQNNHTLQILDIQSIDQNQESKLEGFQAAWEIVKQKLHRNNLIRLSKISSKKHHISFPYQKKANTSPTHKSLDQSSFFVGGEKLDSTRIKGTSDHYRIGLSIDGGGMRGIIPGCIIQYICQRTKREVHEIFDIIGGTSIGGILALTLACSNDGKNPIARGVDLPQFFEENGSTIFNSSKMVALWNNLRDKSKYDPAGIESILKRYFQNCKLSDVIKGTNVITTAMKRECIRGKNMSKIFRSKEAMFSDDKNFYVRDIGRATSAAPTYFPSAEIKNVNGTKKYSLIDGALGQNNPSKLVLDDIKTEALNSGNEKNYYLLSLSTGTAITTQQLAQNAGLFNLMPIINSLGEGALAFLDRDIEKSADGQYLRINPEIPIKKHEAELDNTDPKIVEIYKQCAYSAAEKSLSQDLKYGPFNDQNFLDWLAENTAKKKDTYI